MDFFNFSYSLLSAYDIWLLGTAALCSLFLIDDLFVDALALFKGKKAHKILPEEFKKMNSIPERKIAIIVANWREDQVLERMVAGNINNINYSNYEILVGVYPNDTLSLEAARRAEKRFKNVTVIVNNINGPTSKGQMLNLVVNYIDIYNQQHPAAAFDMILIHDAEDVIHHSSLKLVNFRNLEYDFIQIPVFSLDIPAYKLTAGIYIDEFIEAHTKDLLVRDHFNAGLPSAGVGTVISMSVVQKLLKLQGGKFLDESTLTEDYHLGLVCHDLKVKSHFSCEYFEYTDKETKKNKKDYIATRGYFPQKIKQSIRQKTRWSLGISLQGFEARRWKSTNFFAAYFLWKDRKGLVNAPLFTTALIFTSYFIATFIKTGAWPSLNYTPYNGIFIALMWANLVFSLVRIMQRISLVAKVYGASVAILVPVRWILSNFINTLSTYNAFLQWTSSKLKGELPVWSKTEHMMPAGFGLEINLTASMEKMPNLIDKESISVANAKLNLANKEI